MVESKHFIEARGIWELVYYMVFTLCSWEPQGSSEGEKKKKKKPEKTNKTKQKIHQKDQKESRRGWAGGGLWPPPLLQPGALDSIQVTHWESSAWDHIWKNFVTKTSLKNTFTNEEIQAHT